MDIDERLRVIAERLDMAVRIHLDYDREYRERMDRLEQARERFEEELRQSRRETERLRTQNEQRWAEVVDAINRLARIAGVHEQRLGDHEQRLDDLSGQ